MGAQKQANRQNMTPRKPRKPKEPPKLVIGSSSTWGETELDRFEVSWKEDVVNHAALIPDKWFDFTALDNYETGGLATSHG
jgi:hypothetical protein